jgi:hypothetical protein
MSKVAFDGVANAAAYVSAKGAEFTDCRRGKKDLMPHDLARL